MADSAWFVVIDLINFLRFHIRYNDDFSDFGLTPMPIRNICQSLLALEVFQIPAANVDACSRRQVLECFPQNENTLCAPIK